MRIGLVTTLNNSGLGAIGKAAIEHLPIDSIFIIRHPKKGTQEEFVQGRKYTLGGYTPTKDEINTYLEEHKPEALIFIEYPYNWNFIRIAYKRNIKIVFIPMVDSVSVRWMTKEQVLGLIDMFICVTKYSHEVMLRNQLPAVHIPWPVDTNQFVPVKKDISGDIQLLHNAGYFGANLSKPRKGTDIVLQAWQTLRNEGFKLTIHAQKEHKKWNLSGVEYIEHDFPEARSLYDKGQIYLAPSRMEGLGLPIDEAMACGLPVITTDAPPMNERVIWPEFLIAPDKVYYTDRSDAVIAEPNVQSLINKVRDLRDMPLTYWGEKCREHMVQNFSWDVLRDRYISVLEGKSQ